MNNGNKSDIFLNSEIRFWEGTDIYKETRMVGGAN